MGNCVWCGKTFEEHDDPRPADAPKPRVPCLLLKSGFKAKEEAPLPTTPVPQQETIKVEELSFVDALREVMNGKKITRVAWHDSFIYGLLKEGFLTIYINGKFDNWAVSIGDLEANDWFVLPE